MGEAQLAWYAQMLRLDHEDEYRYHLDFVEYMASFWNSDAVQKIRDMRDMKESDRFASDEEFERQITEREFKKNEDLIKAIKDKYKNTNLDDIDRDGSRSARESRLPKDMSKLFKMTGEKID